MATPLWAADTEAILALLEQGQAESALLASETWLQTHPQDPEVGFLRARALAELGRTDAAIEAFAAVARAQPQRPGPANNLAVLYARQGKYDQARRWLEAAMETHPAYAIAHRNLGDVYTALAAVAYSKALNPEGQPQDLGVRLELVPRLYPLVGSTTTADGAGAPAVAAVEPRVVPAPPPLPELAAPPAAEPAPAVAADEAMVAQATPVILTAVQTWAEAWSAQDVGAYLNAYADSFNPEGPLPLADWRAQRRERVAAPASIEITITDPVVAMLNADTARVIFEQSYRSDTYNDRVRKTLLMIRTAQGWQIKRETETLL